jgi:hypothetical protein
MNRYDLSLWDVGKRSLYVEKRKASKLTVLTLLRLFFLRMLFFASFANP